MPIIDSQVHVWVEESPDRPWPPGGAERARRHSPDPEPFDVQRLLREMDAAGVDGAILVPPTFEGDRNDTVLEAARRYSPKFGVMGRIPLEKSQETVQLLKEWRSHPGALGLRL